LATFAKGIASSLVPLNLDQSDLWHHQVLVAGCQSLLDIEPALVAILEKHPNAVLRIVSDACPEFKLIDPSRREYIRWSPQNEV
jgi:hypothetical protein